MSATTDRLSKVYLVPWDAADDGQVQRMHDQRVACGWREIEVPEWKELMLKGEKIFYWIVSVVLDKGTWTASFGDSDLLI